jgi:hypothetical protein
VAAADDGSWDTVLATVKQCNINLNEANSLLDDCERCDSLTLEGKKLVTTHQYVEATRVFQEAIYALLGSDFEVPGWSRNHGMIMQRYKEITDWQRLALMRCCNGLVQCRVMLDDLQGVRVGYSLRGL